METKRLSRKELEKAGRIIIGGGIVAFPTETVFGLGGDAYNKEAVEKIFRAKGRAADNPLNVLVDSLERAKSLTTDFSEKAEKLAKAFWPGPLTIVLKKETGIPDIVTAGFKTVGIRLPDSETARELVALSDTPLAAPSANVSGRPSPTSFDAVLEDMDGKIEAVILENTAKVGIESTVIDLTKNPPVILRPGAVTKEEIEEVIGEVVSLERTPGSKYAHYAPKIPLILVKGTREEQEKKIRDQTKKDKEICILSISGRDFGVPSYYLGESPLEWGKNFYNALRVLERSGAQMILAETPEESSETSAFLNRLEEASGREEL